MKTTPILLCCIFFLLPALASAQGIIKAGKAMQNHLAPVKIYQLDNDNSTLNTIAIDRTNASNNNILANNQNLYDTLINSIRIKNKHGKDSILALNTGVKNLNDSLFASEQVLALNNESHVHFIAAGGISNIDDLRKATGNLSIGLQFRLSDNKRVAGGAFKNWIDPHYLYIMFNTRTGTSSDSEILVRTFLFPELHKRDFVIGYFWHLEKNDFGIEPLFEASLSRYSDSAKTKMFRTESFILGTKFYKRFAIPVNKDTVNAVVQLFPFYNLINVDPKYFTDYEQLMSPSGKDNLHPTYHSVGMQAMVQIDNIMLFCNMKYVLNKGRDIDNPDLKRFVYTIGSMITL